MFLEEIEVFKHKAYFNREINTIFVIANGDSDKAIAGRIKEFIMTIYDETAGENINTLIDLNKAGKSTPEARQIWKELGDNKRAYKIALVGLHPVARVIASFVIKIVSRNNCRFFNSQEEALKWFQVPILQ